MVFWYIFGLFGLLGIGMIVSIAGGFINSIFFGGDIGDTSVSIMVYWCGLCSVVTIVVILKVLLSL